MEERSKSLKGSKAIYSLANVNFNGKKKRINSPRSIEALNNLGFDAEDLFFLDFKEFILKFPEFNALPKEIQTFRYEFFEKKRKEKLEQALQTRLGICSQDPEPSSKMHLDELSKSKFSQEKAVSSILNEELKGFERIRKKQEMELLGMVQYELKLEMSRKENEQKLRAQIEKEQMLRNEKLLKQKQEEHQRKRKERERDNRQKLEEEEQKKRDNQKFLEDQMKLKQKEEKEKMLFLEQKRKAEEDRRKQEEFKKQIEDMFQTSQNKIKERQAHLAEKEEERKMVLERKKLERLQSSKERSNMIQRKMELQMRNVEDKLKTQRLEYEDKQRKNEEKRREFEQLRTIAFKEKQYQIKKKNFEIQRVLENNKIIEAKKIEDYHQKKEVLERRREEMEELQKEKRLFDTLRKRERENKIQVILKNNEMQESMKKSKIIEKISKTDEKTIHVSMMKERALMEKSERNHIQRFEKAENIKRISRLREVLSQKTMQKLEEKGRKTEEFKLQKVIISEKRKKIHSEISSKRQDFLSNFDRIFQKKHLDDNAITSLSQMFRGNAEFEKTLNQLKNSSEYVKPIRPQTTTNRFRPKNQILKINLSSANKKNELLLDSKAFTQLPTPIRSSYDPKTEREKWSARPISTNLEKSTYNSSIGMTIQSYKNLNSTTPNFGSMTSRAVPEQSNKNRIEDYRFKLNQELLELLSEEREAEHKREQFLANCKSLEERSKYERIFALERKQATQKIMKFNEEIEDKLSQFERQLIA